MTLTRATTEAISAIRTRVRVECEDPTTDPAGNALPTAGLEFADADYSRAINNQLRFLALRIRVTFPGEALLVTEMTYATETGGTGVQLPAAITAFPISFVEVVDQNIAKEVYWADPKEIEQYATNRENSSAIISDRLYYTLLADASDLTRARIKIRPQPSTITLRIWTVNPAIISSEDTDIPLLSVDWAPLIALGAAMELLSRSNRATEQQAARYQAWLTLFDQEGERRHEQDRIRFPAGRGID